MSDPRQAITNRNERDPSGDRLNRRSDIDWRGILTWIAQAGIPMAFVAAFSIAWTHESRITTLEVRRVEDDRQTEAQLAADAAYRKELKEDLRALGAKIDRALEFARTGRDP
jgi:hypothetical protein